MVQLYVRTGRKRREGKKKHARCWFIKFSICKFGVDHRLKIRHVPMWWNINQYHNTSEFHHRIWHVSFAACKKKTIDNAQVLKNYFQVGSHINMLLLFFSHAVFAACHKIVFFFFFFFALFCWRFDAAKHITEMKEWRKKKTTTA